MNKTKGCLIANFATVPLFVPFANIREVALRIMAMRTGIHIDRLRIGLLREDERQKVWSCRVKLNGAPLLIDESRQFTDDMCQKMGKLKDERGISLGVVDIRHMCLEKDDAKKVWQEFMNFARESRVKVVLFGLDKDSG